MDDGKQGNPVQLPWYFEIWRWLRRRVGPRGAAAVLIFAALPFLWWNWNAVSDKPFVGQLIGYLTRQPLPHRPPYTMTIGITHLEGDPSHEHEQLIRDTLANDFGGVYTAFFDRNVDFPAEETDQESIKEASLAADRLRESSGVDVLIWGRVITLAGKSLTRLYWTARRDMSIKFTDKYPDPADTVALPPLLVEDLRHVIALLVATEVMSAVALENSQSVTDRMRLTLKQIDGLLVKEHGQWNAHDFNRIAEAYADGLEVYGAQANDLQAIERSISLYKDLSREQDVRSTPSNWADVQQHLGVALKTVGVRDTAANSLLEAVDAYRNALTVFTESLFPNQWATAQLALGSALETLAVRAKEDALREGRFNAAVEAYAAALRVCTRDRERDCWVAARMDLGNAFDDWGRLTRSTYYTRSGLDIFRDLAQILSRDNDPLTLAEVQINLGIALNNLGSETSEKSFALEAVTAEKAALSLLSETATPYLWAKAQENLAAAYSSLASRGDLAMRSKQIWAFRQALRVWRRGGDPRAFILTECNLAFSLMQYAGQTRSPFDSQVADAAGLKCHNDASRAQIEKSQVQSEVH